MAQVYAIVHDGTGTFIIAWKNPCSYFFHEESGGGTIYPTGTRINGPDDWAFPGGGLKGGGVEVGALTELLEETNVTPNPIFAQPANYAGKGYYGVYLNVSNQLDAIYNLIATNLAIGVSAVQAITAPKSIYTADKYDQLMTDFPGCPADNELLRVERWNLLTDSNKISDLNRKGTDWYYPILMNLQKQTVYPAAIIDVNGNIVGASNDVGIHPGDEGFQFFMPGFQYDAAKLLPKGDYTLHFKGINYTVTVVSLNAPGDTSIFSGDEADTQ